MNSQLFFTYRRQRVRRPLQKNNIRIENNPSYVIITSLLNRCQQSNVKNIQVTCKFIAEKVYTYIYDQTNINIK